MDVIPSIKAVGCLLFVARISRLEMSFAVNMLSRFSSNPGKHNFAILKLKKGFYSA